jgi:hypothetical protein
MALPTITQADGITRLTLKTTVSANVGDLIGHDGTDWVLADADARIPASYIAMESVAAGGSVQVASSGTLLDTDAPYTAGADQYLTGTAGGHGAIPTLGATLSIVQRLGRAVSTSEFAFDLAHRPPLVLRATASVNPASLATDVAGNTAVTITGIAANDVITPIPPAALENLHVQSAIASTDTVTVRLGNATAGTIDAASATWTFYASRY